MSPTPLEVREMIARETAKMPTVDHNGQIVETYAERQAKQAREQRLQAIRDQDAAAVRDKAERLHIDFELEGQPAEPARRLPMPNPAAGAGYTPPPTTAEQLADAERDGNPLLAMRLRQQLANEHRSLSSGPSPDPNWAA
jgi:hypothetical protein